MLKLMNSMEHKCLKFLLNVVKNKISITVYPNLIFTLINQSLLCLKIVDFFLYIELSPLSNKIHQQKYRSFEETFFHKKSLKVLVLFYVHFQHKKHMNSSNSRKLFLNTDKRTEISEKQFCFHFNYFFSTITSI